jgi:hypothetical protein
MKRIFLFFILSLPIVLLTCSPPPFNLSISEAAKTAKQLSYVGQIGPISSMSGNQGNEDVVFIPEKDGAGGITLQAGFLYSQDPLNGNQASFVAYDAGQGKYIYEGGSQWLDAYANVLVQSVKSLHNVIAFQIDDVTPASNRFGLMIGDTIGHTFTPPAWIGLTAQTTGNFPPGPYSAIGISIIPTNNPGFDRAYMLLADTGNGMYREARYHVSQAAPGLTNPSSIFRTTELDLVGYGVIPAGIQRVLYYYDSASTNAFAMWNTGSHWTCVKWTESPPTVPLWQPMPGINHRIDALLTTGELFSTEDNTARVYIGGVPTMLFSQALWFNQQVTFNVYSLPTSKVKTLGQ